MAVLARGIAEDADFAAEWVFTDRRDGVSVGVYASQNFGGKVGDEPDAVARNRAVIAGYVGADAVAIMHQVHGREVVRLESVPADPPSADASITRVAGLPLATQVADCVPILLADLAGGQVAAVHAGWRGVAADVVGAALDQLAPPGRVHAWIGPAICPGCYEVSAEVRDEVATSVPAAAAVTRQGTPAVDLRAGVLAQLARYGVSGELVGGCTFESPLLYSFRRDAVTGRQVGVIVLRERHGG